MTKADFIAALRESLGDGTFVRLTLGAYAGADDSLKSIHARRITVKRQDKISFTFRHKTRDIVKNHDIDAAVDMIAQWMGGDFHHAVLFTTAFDMQYDRGRVRRAAATTTAAPPATHDRTKNHIVAPDRPYMRALKIADAQGKVYAAAQDKFRQINKYIEILDKLIDGISDVSGLRIADMGSGKGYLTFALYDHLRHARGLTDVRVTGVEYRADMVALCNDIAGQCGYDGLSFVRGSIADYDAAGTDILIALHACDTATDDALAAGVRAGARLLVVAPCCHKQIRREMESARDAAPDLSFMLRHGTFMERQAEMVTDALRALILEGQGYTTRAFEFIADAHTPKNVMIVATRAKTQPQGTAQKIAAAKTYFGVKTHALEEALR